MYTSGFVVIGAGLGLLLILLLMRRFSSDLAPLMGAFFVVFVLAPLAGGVTKLFVASWGVAALVATGVVLPFALFDLIKEYRKKEGWEELLGKGMMAVSGLVFGLGFGFGMLDVVDRPIGWLENSQPCTARVIDLQETNIRVNKQDVLQISVRVHPDEGAEFLHATKEPLSVLQVARILDGRSSFRCRMSADHRQVEILWSEPVSSRPSSSPTPTGT